MKPKRKPTFKEIEKEGKLLGDIIREIYKSKRTPSQKQQELIKLHENNIIPLEMLQTFLNVQSWIDCIPTDKIQAK